MITIEEITNNLIGVKVNSYNDVIEVFEDYAYNGVNSVIVSDDIKYNNPYYDLEAYADSKDAPQIGIKLKDNIVIEANIL